MTVRSASSAVLLLLFLTGCNLPPLSSPKGEEQTGDTDGAMMERSSKPSTAPSSAKSSTNVDLSKSTITFEGKSNIVNHKGGFRDFTVVLKRNKNDPSNFEKASVNITIQSASVYAGGGVEGPLKREDFFDVEQYPKITFVSKSIQHVRGDLNTIVGDLTIKGVTKSVSISALVTQTGIRATFNLPRRDFKVGNDSYGNKLLEPLVPVNAFIALK